MVTKKMSRVEAWANAAADAESAIQVLIDFQSEFQEWRDNLPENFSEGAVAEKLDDVCDLDLEGALATAQEAADADLPLGFGRD